MNFLSWSFPGDLEFEESLALLLLPLGLTILSASSRLGGLGGLGGYFEGGV
jgi:hypothetical protein